MILLKKMRLNGAVFYLKRQNQNFAMNLWNALSIYLFNMSLICYKAILNLGVDPILVHVVFCIETSNNICFFKSNKWFLYEMKHVAKLMGTASIVSPF